MKIIKFFGAGITAFIILCLLCFLYYKIPTHSENMNQNTDFIWEPNGIWIKFSEGFSFGKFDSNGYNNLKVINDPDIIVLGSSHTIATEVFQNENFSYVLNEKLNGKLKVYNLGMSNHTLMRNSANLRTNLDLYKSAKYVIMETNSLSVNENEVNNIINNTYDKLHSYDNGIMGKLQKIPYLRLIYMQYNMGLLKTFGINSNSSINEDLSSNSVREENVDKNIGYDKLFKFYSDIEKEYDVNIIIFYHPSEKLSLDGIIKYDTNLNELELFSNNSSKYDITFVNMEDRFLGLYNDDHYVPHGYSNNYIGSGHLNKHGHYVIADELYKTIIEMED